MIEIVGVRFRSAGKIYYFAPNGLSVEAGQKVIVQTVRGTEIGLTVLGNRRIEDTEAIKDLSPVLRIATNEDLKKDRENRQKEKRAFDICEEKIKKHGLEMKLINVEYTFDCSKIVFCFVAEGRIDFRELVKDLASVFKTRIELRQIGVRDQTKAVAGLGLCGRKVCCAAFLPEFDQITVKMAKDQGLSSSPQKISGPCGKLICCLAFEQKAYEEDLKELPKLGAYIKTPDGFGTVCEVSALKEGVKVRLELKPDDPPSFYKKEDLKRAEENADTSAPPQDPPKAASAPRPPRPVKKPKPEETQMNADSRPPLSDKRKSRPQKKPKGQKEKSSPKEKQE